MKNIKFPEQKELLEELFGQLDPELMGSDYQTAIKNGTSEELIRATAAYFRSRPEKSYCRTIDLSMCTVENAERAAGGNVTVVNIPWQFPEVKINWHFNPTLTGASVNNEWLWQLNRMNFWRDLVYAYGKTGDEKYARTFNDQFFSWVSTAGTVGEQWNVPNCVWRTIEAGLRMMYSWPLAFEVFRKSPHFTDENICLMLSSMYRHALHLQAHHKSRTNWLLMEMSGLFTVGALFPEFRSSVSMREYAARQYSRAVMEQILPDGVYDELSPDYHSVMLGCAWAFYQIAREEKIEAELPAEFLHKLELSFESILDMATPALDSPRTNDCFTCSVIPKMNKGIAFFPSREDFRWGAAARKEGKAPASVPSCSRFLPWGGWAVMRSDWSSEALYCAFDVGPLGMAHIHQDKLNINIYKGSEELIYDDGGGEYEHSIYRAYGVSAADHNTVLVDGLLQRRQQPRKLEKTVDCSWVSNETMDYAKGIYEDEFGPLVLCEKDAQLPLSRPARHTREVHFFKPDFFCVLDTLSSLDGNVHSYELRWQLDTLKMEQCSEIPGAWLSDYGRSWDILIVPLLAADELQSCVLSGVDTPPMGGWFVGRNDKKLHKSSTLTMSFYGKKECRFATLLIPVKRSEKLPRIEKRGENLFSVCLNGKTFTVDLANLQKE